MAELKSLNRDFLVRHCGESNILENIKELNLMFLYYRVKFQRIESNTFKGLINLEKLRLENNQIEEINVNGLVDLKNLKELYLYNNKLKRIDRSCFEPLKSIALIELHNNELYNNEYFFWNKTIKNFYRVSPGREIEKIKEISNENGGFISEWKDFLKQFPQSSGKLFCLFHPQSMSRSNLIIPTHTRYKIHIFSILQIF